MPRKDISQIKLSSYKHSFSIQIRFVDMDLAGHANNATILSYFETARVDLLDEIIGQGNDWRGRGLIIAHTEIDYLQPVYLADKIKVYDRVVRLGNKSFEVESVLVKSTGPNEVIAAFATVVLVCMDYNTKQTVEISQEWKDKLRAYEQVNKL